MTLSGPGTSETPLLDQIDSPDDLKKLSREQLPALSAELRGEIIRVCSRGGLHLASSLGATDIVVALHYVLNSPTDRILFDVGHQAYAHKILTGRRGQMHTLKQEGGLSGFTKVSESEHDAITVGHASTSLANALGMALARDARGQDYKIATVIGDGSLTGGMALAALNTIGDLQPNMLIILNDNEMSISENVGGLNKFMRGLQVQRWVREGEDMARRSVQAVSKSLADLMSRAKHSTRHFFDPNSVNPFAAMGLRYVGPVDGHNVTELVWLMENLVNLEGPTILHVVTRKGKGLSFAEEDPISWHGPAKFDPATGEFTPSNAYSWSSAFGDAVTEWADEDPNIYVITPAMREGSGLVRYSQEHPDRYLDVGIAEDVAVTSGAGMALAGVQPIVAIYSSFLQRGFDQVLHDVAIENLNVIFAVDRGGIVGADGATHNGVFDLSFLRCIPNVEIAQPRSTGELRAMLRAAAGRGPVAIRYPRGNTDQVEPGTWPEIEWGSWERLKSGDDIVVLATGKPLAGALAAAEWRPGTGVINARFVKPLDQEMLREIATKARAIVTAEDNTVRGGFGSAVLEFLSEEGLDVPVHVVGIPDEFQEHATPESVYARAGLDAAGLSRLLDELEKDPRGVKHGE